MSISSKLSLFILLLLFIGYPPINAQTKQGAGNISGSVKSNDGSPIDFAIISIKGLRKTVADENGSFSMKNIPSGTYTITASFVGFESKSQEVTVNKGETSVANFRLTENQHHLTEVVVNGRTSKKVIQRESESASRMPLKNLENAQVYNVVTNALMKEQIVVDRSELYLNIPGAVPNFSAGGSQGISQRGFLNTNGMRNGLNTNAIYPMNPAILERVEVMRGPSGTLFGTGRNTTFGGVFNYVTKRPFAQNAVELSLTGGNYEFARVAADVNTVLDKEGTQLLRVNIAGQNEGSFQSEGFSRNFVFAPSFALQVNDKLKLLFEGDITRTNYTTTSYSLPANLNAISYRSFADSPIPYDLFLGDDNVDSKVGVNEIGAEAEYKISDKWKSQTKFLFSEGYYDRLLWGTFAILSDTKINRTVRNQTPENFGNVQLQQNFIGDFNLGSFRNRVVAGLDYNRTYNTLNRVTFKYDEVDINQPIPDFNMDRVNALSLTGWSASSFTSNNYSAYVSDVFNISPALMAMLSLRGEYYKTDGNFSPSTGKYSGGFDKTALSPKLGLVYQPLKDKLSLFVNYMNGFNYLAPAQQQVNSDLSGLKPQYGNQLEGGVKFAFMNNRISGSASYYDIKVTNSTRTESVSPGGGAANQVITVQDGTQNSKGFEFDVTANPFEGFNVIAGYAYNENKYTKASPALTGKNLTSSPKNVANLWLSYSILRGSLSGIGFGAGGNYVDESWFDSANLFTNPSYTLINATVFYNYGKYRLGVKANNISDAHYWNSTGMPQKSRYFLAELRYRF